MKIAVTIAATLVVAALLYSWKAFTFAVWVNAAMMSHAHPKVAVSLIELGILTLAALAIYGLIVAVSHDVSTKR